jgi:hypothetical protein
MAPRAWLNPAGGLRYHARAALGARLWAPFRVALGRWLCEFEPNTERAVLVGPSAGHCISDAFLCRFTELTVLEPDPIAGLLLTRRLQKLGRPRLRVEQSDRLVRPLLDGSSGLPELLEAQPGACVVFCNLLGQTRFLMTEDEAVRFKLAFRERVLPVLEQRAWLSFHDRLSGSLRPAFEAPLTAPSRLTDAEVLRDLYPAPSGVRQSELLDHDSDGFFPDRLPHSYFVWQIERARWHLIEGVASSGAGR